MSDFSQAFLVKKKKERSGLFELMLMVILIYVQRVNQVNWFCLKLYVALPLF